MASNDLPTRKQIRDQLRPTIIAEPLLSQLAVDPYAQHHVIIELNSAYTGGLEEARKFVKDLVKDLVAEQARGALSRNIDGARYPFVFAELTAQQIYNVVDVDGDQAAAKQRNIVNDDRAAAPVTARAFRAIFKIWESARIQPLTIASIKTVKADAALSAFTAAGDRIVWAVLDSGIDKTHPHFVKYDNLTLDLPLAHESFAPVPSGSPSLDPLEDQFGHGTHVAGIIAGASDAGSTKPLAARESVNRSSGGTGYELQDVSGIRGMAPKCKLLSLRVLDSNGGGDVTAVINALEKVIQLNGDGQQPLVHGVNISAGYLPDPEHYGSGQSPVCRQVNRAVRSGLVVVAASGNYGYAAISALQKAGAQTRWNAGQFITITDPGNADLAITVGSTHREEPHRYGISFFSSKGPTSDGRAKPDVVAPGERIVSCAAGTAKQTVQYLMQSAGAAAPPAFDYVEDSGTSMAAPHVSGVIAAFLSIRREFIGAPEKIASLVTASAMDLGRDARLQGAGLVDLFKMIQQV